MKRYKSHAQWQTGVCDSMDNHTCDNHDTPEQAHGVCKMLAKEGFGGDNKVYPIRTWVEDTLTGSIHSVMDKVVKYKVHAEWQCGFLMTHTNHSIHEFDTRKEAEDMRSSLDNNGMEVNIKSEQPRKGYPLKTWIEEVVGKDTKEFNWDFECPRCANGHKLRKVTAKVLEISEIERMSSMPKSEVVSIEYGLHRPDCGIIEFYECMGCDSIFSNKEQLFERLSGLSINKGKAYK